MRRAASRFRGAGAFVLRHLAFNVQVALEYRASFLTQVLFMIANNFLLLFFWWILFRQVSDVGGWGRRETMLLVGIASAGFGLAAIVCGNVFRLSRLVADGQLDVYLLLPRDPLLHALVGRTVVAGVGDLAFGLGAIWILGPPTWGGQAAMLLAVVASAITFAAFGVLVHSLAFWMGDASGLASFLHDALLALSMYPQSIYPERVKLFLFTAIPVGFFAHVPVAIARDPDPGLIALALAFALAFAQLARMVFASGLTRYQSGNLLAGRS